MVFSRLPGAVNCNVGRPTSTVADRLTVREQVTIFNPSLSDSLAKILEISQKRILWHGNSDRDAHRSRINGDEGCARDFVGFEATDERGRTLTKKVNGPAPVVIVAFRPLWLFYGYEQLHDLVEVNPIKIYLV